MQDIRKITPYQDEQVSKKGQVEQMFDNIAPRYDFLNHFLSLGIDKLWRKRAVKLLKPLQPKVILDIATGTADFAIELAKLNPDRIVGADISEAMLAQGRVKVAKLKLDNLITLQRGDSEQLPFQDNTFDAITVAFGVRNFEDTAKGIGELFRVLKPNGMLVVLEFSKPKVFPVKQLFYFYFHFILPVVGKFFSKDPRAYTYLPESVQSFPEGKDFLRLLDNAGFKSTQCINLSFGISSIYTGTKS